MKGKYRKVTPAEKSEQINRGECEHKRCKCHDEPMRWRSDARKPSGGVWRCEKSYLEEQQRRDPDKRRATYLRNRESYRERKREKDRRYYWKNRDKISESSRLWREKNREKLSEYGRQHRIKNADKIRDYQHRYYEEHKEQKKAYDRAYRQENRDKIQDRIRQYKRLRANERDQKTIDLIIAQNPWLPRELIELVTNYQKGDTNVPQDGG